MPISWIRQRIFKSRSTAPIGASQQYSPFAQCWLNYEYIYTIRKLDDNLYEAGCFQGTYDEALLRINRDNRSDILKAYYLRQLAKASR